MSSPQEGWPSGPYWAKHEPDDPLNCGRCHKCVLTMLELLAVGRLDACPMFAADDVSPEMTNRLRVSMPTSLGYFRELVAPLRARGREDLAAAIAHKIAVLEEVQRWRRAAAWWRVLRRGSDRRLVRWAQRRGRVDATGAPRRSVDGDVGEYSPPCIPESRG